MSGYHFDLALRSLRRNVVLTALMVIAVGVGIGAYMTVLTALIAMSGDPIPDKSGQLFVPQIDVWGPATRPPGNSGQVRLPEQFIYRDAKAFMDARAARRQTAMYAVQPDVTPPLGAPYAQQGRAAHRDFFEMFEGPFAQGAAWSERDETSRADVVVLGATRTRTYQIQKSESWLLEAVVGLMLAITAFGTVGLTMYRVGQRRRQIGMRRALGARRVDILRYFHTENLLISGAGVVLGVAAGLGANLWMATHLGAERMSLLYIGMGAVMVVVLSQLAVLWPALRAASIQPSLAIRGL
jgi:FtsX-like permease family/MacB-like periplasmic core domain